MVIRKWHIEGLVILVLWIILALATRQVDAQDVNTGFTVSCESGDPAHVIFIVTSDGVEDYSFSVFGESGQTTIPSHFTTHIGVYELGWLDASSLNLEAHFTNSFDMDAVYPINPDYFTGCDHDAVLDPVEEVPVSQPETPAICVASAIDGSTGRAYCFVPSASGIIPIPPPYSED